MKNFFTAVALTLGLFLPMSGQVQAKPAATPTPAATTKAALIDINSADEKTLQTIAGIGDAYSKKIIAGRPYKGKDDLVSKKILPKGVYDKIKDQIIAKQK